MQLDVLKVSDIYLVGGNYSDIISLGVGDAVRCLESYRHLLQTFRTSKIFSFQIKKSFQGCLHLARICLFKHHFRKQKKTSTKMDEPLVRVLLFPIPGRLLAEAPGLMLSGKAPYVCRQKRVDPVCPGILLHSQHLLSAAHGMSHTTSVTSRS